jgi:hypothetical protein
MNDHLKDALSTILILAVMGGIVALGLYVHSHYHGNADSKKTTSSKTSKPKANNNSRRSYDYDDTDTDEQEEDDEVYYDNCSEARENGAESIEEGEPGYREELDRDGDGVACEPWHGR